MKLGIELPTGLSLQPEQEPTITHRALVWQLNLPFWPFLTAEFNELHCREDRQSIKKVARASCSWKLFVTIITSLIYVLLKRVNLSSLGVKHQATIAALSKINIDLD